MHQDTKAFKLPDGIMSGAFEILWLVRIEGFGDGPE